MKPILNKPRAMANSKALIAVVATFLLASCFDGNGEKDNLRDPISDTGISLGLQVNLPLNSTTAQAVAAIYKDGTRQPLVGGDFFLASSENQGDSAVLKSLENLSGDYQGALNVLDEFDQIIIATVYDPQRAREDRWYPTDQLLVDPGPNEDLVNYSETFSFPALLENLTINQQEFSARSDMINLAWTSAGNLDPEEIQMSSNAVITCYGVDGSTVSYPRFNVLGTDDGSATLDVGDFIPNVNILNAVATLQAEVLTIISAALLEVVTFGLVDSRDIPLATFELAYCTVDVTVFREQGFALPDQVSGGFAIASTSDNVRFTFRPPVAP